MYDLHKSCMAYAVLRFWTNISWEKNKRPFKIWRQGVYIKWIWRSKSSFLCCAYFSVWDSYLLLLKMGIASIGRSDNYFIIGIVPCNTSNIAEVVRPDEVENHQLRSSSSETIVWMCNCTCHVCTTMLRPDDQWVKYLDRNCNVVCAGVTSVYIFSH